eukprot:Em0452g7a
MNGFVNVINNFGPGLRIIGALVHVNGSITLVNNSANGHVGGALYISSFGQLNLYQGSEMKFINNSGMIGAAIVVDVQKSSKPFSQLINNPQCFLTFDNRTSAPKNYKGAAVTIIGNTAAVGPAIYISHLDLCAWISNNNSIPVFDSTYFPKWAILDMDPVGQCINELLWNPEKELQDVLCTMQPEFFPASFWDARQYQYKKHVAWNPNPNYPSYPSLVHNCMSLLHCPTLPDNVTSQGSMVIPIYLLTFTMTAHAYIMPYKEWWQNMIEMIVSANFIIILVLRSTQSIVTYLTMFPGTSIPDSRGVQLAEPDKLTDFFGAFVYFPLGAALLMGVAWIVVTKCKIRNKPNDKNGDVDFGDTSTPYVWEIEKEFRNASS